MTGSELQELGRLIGELKALASRARRLSSEIPAAERNLYAILRHIEMLEIEISDPIRVLHGNREGEV